MWCSGTGTHAKPSFVIVSAAFKMPAKDTVALDDDVELRTVALASPLNRTMVKDAIYTEESIETAKGKVLVAFAGDRKKPAIVTYHDLGLNYISNFQAIEFRGRYVQYRGYSTVLRK